jgi:cytochrome P450
MLGYIRSLVERKRRDPAPDLLSALVAVRDGDDRLSGHELSSMIFLLLTAGHETTVNLIGNAVLNLLADPGQRALLSARPELLDAVVDETLRADSPVQVSLRTCVEPVETGGTTIPAGATVILALLAANRDPARFPEPDRFRIDRPTNPQLGFGHGFHHCIGAPLARIEAAVAVGSLLARFPGLRLDADADDLRWRASVIMHGLEVLPVHLGDPLPPTGRSDG